MEETVEALPPGKRIGPYTIERELGRGAAGVVYLAEDATLKRKVAVKVLSDEASAERFLREARAAAGIAHHNVVQVYAAEMEARRAYIAMEHVEGETLAELIRREGRLDWRRALGGARQAAYALDAAHAEGVIHRDLKPSNIFVSGETVKVKGFGLAAVPEDWGKLASNGTLLGTPLYASPEQCEGGEIDVRSDVYSLGVVLFEVLSGKTPFEAPTPAALFRRMSTEKLPDLAKLVPGLPPAVADLVGRMLARKKEERMATAHQVATEIYQILRSPVVIRKRANWPVYLGVAAGVFLVAGAVFLRFTKTRTPMVPGLRSDPQLPIVAVGPFRNRAAEAELSWLGPGLADFVAADLSAARGLRVSREDRVPWGGYGLSGTFARAGGRLRIDAQLTDPATGEILFARKVEGDAGELFALVDSLCEKLLDSASEHFGAQALDASELGLEGRLFRGEAVAAEAARAPARLRAVELYYRAQQLLYRGEEEEARGLLEEARKLGTGFRRLER